MADIVIRTLSAVFGLVIGSFLNVCIYRIPRGESVIAPPSHCPNCRKRLRFYDLVPLFSYLFLLGRCRYCYSRISIRYPLIEVLTGLLFVCVSVNTGNVFASAVPYWYMMAILVVCSAIDLEYRRIPNTVTYPSIAAALLLSLIPGGIGILSSLQGILLGGGIMLLVAILSRGGMGMGDVKLIAVFGGFLGWRGALYSIAWGSIIGSVIGIILLIMKVIRRKDPIPFGPFLSAGAVITFFFM